MNTARRAKEQFQAPLFTVHLVGVAATLPAGRDVIFQALLPKGCRPMNLKLFTIGFTQKTAEHFFTTLRDAGVEKVIDVRLNNESQLAGFSKKADLPFFLKEIANIDYVHLPELAPTPDILDAYRKNKGGWHAYERAFLKLLARREVEKKLTPTSLQKGCLLCSEHLPHHCHRRLIAEYLGSKWHGVQTQHLY